MALEGFVDWDYPPGEEYSDFPRLNAEGKKKILGLNAAKLYGIEVPAEYQLKDGGTPGAHEVLGGQPEEHAASGA